MSMKKTIFSALIFLILSCPYAYADGTKCNILFEESSCSSYREIVLGHSSDARDCESEKILLDALAEGIIIESYEDTARKALEASIAQNWRADYVASVVIAVDRAKTRLPIRGWRDLRNLDENVALSPDRSKMYYLLAAASYGLEGENYSMDAIMDILRSLHKKKRLVLEDEPQALWICFDYEAAALQRQGRDLEIIIPQEGTMSFEKGLLSKGALPDSKPYEAALLRAGMRTLNGDYLYPIVGSYENAVPYSRAGIASSSERTEKRFYRQVLHQKLFASADAIEKQLHTILYIILTLLWIGYIRFRAMRKDVNRSVMITGAILVIWGLIRLLKYQLTPGILVRMLWFSYYILMALQSSLLLYLCSKIPNYDLKQRLPLWIKALVFLDLLCILAVFSNDLHHMVFIYDLSGEDWLRRYTYAPLYYAIYLYILLKIAAAAFMFLWQCKNSLNRKRILLPFILCLILFGYSIGYITKLPFFFHTEFSIVFGSFIMLFLEAEIAAGMLPVNTHYGKIFKNSGLNMRIEDMDGHTVYRSKGRSMPEEDVLNHNEDIRGGRVFWQEYVGDIKKAARELEHISKQLNAANHILEEEEKIRHTLEQSRIRRELIDSLNLEIKAQTEALSSMASDLELCFDPERRKQLISEMMIMLCYIKRRCNLFFRQREGDLFPTEEVVHYMRELSDLTDYTVVKTVFLPNIHTELCGEVISFLYDFYFYMTKLSLEQCLPMMVRFSQRDQNVLLEFLIAGDIEEKSLPEKFLHFLPAYKGRLEKKEFGDSLILQIMFASSSKTLRTKEQKID